MAKARASGDIARDVTRPRYQYQSERNVKYKGNKIMVLQDNIPVDDLQGYSMRLLSAEDVGISRGQTWSSQQRPMGCLWLNIRASSWSVNYICMVHSRHSCPCSIQQLYRSLAPILFRTDRATCKSVS